MASSKAQAFKEKGNAAFKSGDYPTAIGYYTSAILADPDRKDVTFPLNRAAAYLKLGKYADTERDCNTVLSISGPKSNVKALFRRGQARVGLGKLLEAQQDFTDVLSQEPSNTSAFEELKNVNNLIQKEKAKKAKVLPVSVASPPTSSTTPAVKRRRVPIRIVGDIGTASANGASSSSAIPAPKPATSKSTTLPPPSSDTPSSVSVLPDSSSSSTSIQPTSTLSKSNNDTLQAISSRSLKPLPSDKMDVDSPQTSSTTSSSQQGASTKAKQEPSSFKEAKQARDAKSPRVGGGIFRASGQNTIFASRGGSDSDMATDKDKESEREREKKEKKQDDVEMETVSPSPPPRLANGADTLKSTTQVPPTSKASLMQLSPSPQPPPTTLFDFSRTWYALKSPWEKWAFLNTIPPAQFPELCKTSLETSLLVSILDVFLTVLTTSRNGDTPEDVDLISKKIRVYMDDFARIARFSTLVLFLSKPEKEVAREVWRALGVDRPEGVWKSVGGK